jgi:hypothetical protein
MMMSASAPSTPLEDRMGWLIRIKARPICEYKNWCGYAALTRISRPRRFHDRCGGGRMYEIKKETQTTKAQRQESGINCQTSWPPL